MEVAWPGGKRQRWVARIGDRVSDLLSLDDCKRDAAAMLRAKAIGQQQDDPIAWLNRVAVAEIDGV
jgi:hypothetical protein